MPQLSDLIGKRKFVKKEYRPWDLSGTGTVDGKQESSPGETSANEATVIANTIPLATETAFTHQPSLTTNILDQDETGNKTGNVTGNKQVTTRQQTGNKQVTRIRQRDNNQVTNRQQPGNVTDNVTGNTDSLAYLIDSIKKIAGIQKIIFFYVINVCSARGVLDTGNILSADLANAANCSIGSAKTSLIRLIEKQLILRLEGKASRGGHMVLGITKEIQAAAIQAQQALFNPLKRQQTDNITGNVTDNMASYSSSSYKNNITTALPDEWKKINFELLEPIGFSETQLKQLHDSQATAPEIVQDSINRFSFSLEHSDKVKAYNDPLNVLMGVLRKGQRWNEPNYISQKELALRHVLEEKRKQKEQYDAMIKELVDLEYPEWRKKLTDDEIKQIVPADILKMNVSAATQSVLRTHFIEKIISSRFKTDN
jgi:hypothetical protein